MNKMLQMLFWEFKTQMKKRGIGILAMGSKRVGLALMLMLSFLLNSLGQTTFTSPTNPTGNWTAIAWVKTGTATAATYPGQVAGENHIVVIGVTGNGAGRTLTLNVNITQSVSSVSINYTGTRTATLAMGNNTLTMTGNLTGNGIVTMGTGTLNIGGSNTIGTFNCGTGTVNYNALGIQTVGAYTFNNLTLSGSGAKTTTGVTVNGVLSMEGTATASVAPAYGGTATLQYNTATARTTGPEWITPFAATGGIVIANTGAITLGTSKVLNTSVPLTINSGATLNTSAANNYALTFGGDFNNNGGTFAANASPIFSR
jgi:hypothetical protein